MTDGDRFGASLPSKAANASWKSPIDTPRRYRIGSRASRLGVRRAQRGRMADVKRIRSPVSPAPRSRNLTRCTAIGPMPVWTWRSGPWPCRTKRSRPSGIRTPFIAARNSSPRPRSPAPVCEHLLTDVGLADAHHLSRDAGEASDLFRQPDGSGVDRRLGLHPGLRHRHMGHAVRCHGRGVGTPRDQCGLGRSHRARLPQGKATSPPDRVLSRHCSRCGMPGLLTVFAYRVMARTIQ